jgi:hypothetical protein
MLATINVCLHGIEAAIVHVEVNAGEAGEPKLIKVMAKSPSAISRAVTSAHWKGSHSGWTNFRFGCTSACPAAPRTLRAA